MVITEFAIYIAHFIYNFDPATPNFLIDCGLFSLVTIVTITDLRTMMIPDKILKFFGIYFVLVHAIYFYPDRIETDILGSIFGLGCPLCVWLINRHGMGLGDVKLFLLLGFILGPENIFLCIVLSCVMGIGYVVVMLSVNILKQSLSFFAYKMIRNAYETRGVSQKPLPFAPFISLAAILSYLCGDALLSFLKF